MTSRQETQRVNGRCRYAEDVVQLIAMLRFAQRAGFTVAEIRSAPVLTLGRARPQHATGSTP